MGRKEMNKIKIAFFDIDGTLLNMGKTDMTPNTKEALCLLKQNGIKICIATGRVMTSIPVSLVQHHVRLLQYLH